MAETLSGHPLGDVISRFIKMLGQDPAFQGAEQSVIEAEALKRAKTALEQRSAAKKAVEDRERARKAKEWADRVKSGDAKTQQQAQQDAARSKYPEKMTVAQAKEQIAQVEQVAATNVPAWLTTSIHESPQAAVCIASITELSPTLRDNPNVLYAELAKLNKSVKWSEASVAARKEARVVQDKVLARISEVAKNDPTFGDAPRDGLLEAVDPGRIHLKTVTDIGPSGAQTKHLQDTIDDYQEFFDLPANRSAENQHEQLEQLIKELRSGSIGENSQYNRKEAMEYIASAQTRINELNAVLAQQRQIQHDEQYGVIKITMADLRDTPWYKGDLVSASAKSLPNNKVFDLGRSWTPQDIDFLLEHGYRDWFYQYADRVFGLGMERVQPSLAQQYKWEDFQNFIYELYGGDEGRSIITEFQKHWEDRSKYDYVIHAMGLGMGDTKHRLEAMSMFQSSDVDYLTTFPGSDLAFSFMERETFSLMAEKLEAYEGHKKWLAEEVGNDFRVANDADALKRVRLAYAELEKKDPKKFKELVKFYQKEDLRRDEYIFVLDAEKLLMTPDQFASHQPLHTEIQLRRDTAARGVVLEDVDVWGYADIEIDLTRTQEKLNDLQDRMKKSALTDEEKKNYPESVKYLQDRTNLLLQKKFARLDDIDPSLRNSSPDDPKLMSFLATRKGLSVLENRVYDRMSEYLRITKGEEPNEWDIRMAIWAARINIMATGRMAAIGAMMARVPGGDRDYHEFANPKDIMRAPAFEDLVRIMNPEMFAARFNMGGKMGEVIRSYLRFNMRKGKIEGGQSKVKQSFFDTDEWKALKVEHRDAPTQMAMKMMEFGEKDLGIKFSELLTQGIMAAGGQYDGTTWRMDLGIIDEIKARYLELQKSGSLPERAILDNQALAIRYLIAKGPEEKRQVLERMMRRTPTKFFQLLADERQDMLRQVNLTPESWSVFENALKYAETDLWKNKAYAIEEIDLATQDHFNQIVKPHLEKLVENYNKKIADRNKKLPKNIQLPLLDTDVEKYRKLIEVMQTRLSATVHGRPYESILDGLAREKLPLTLSLDDFNWQDSNMKMLGNLAFPRRTRDIGNMEQARNIILEFISNRENILSSSDTKGTIKKFMDLKTAIDAYAGTPTAEPVIKELVRLYIEANRDRSLWNLPSFLPGGQSIGMWLAEMDLRPDAPYRSKVAKVAMRGIGKVGEFTIGNLAKLSSKVKPLESFLNWMMPGWKGFSKESFEKWPHSIAEAISYSVRYTGAGGNRWGEKQINEVLHQMQQAGLFSDNPEFVHDLRGEFKAGFGINLFAVARRYWWVIPAATIAVALMGEVEEEKKGHH